MYDSTFTIVVNIELKWCESFSEGFIYQNISAAK